MRKFAIRAAIFAAVTAVLAVCWIRPVKEEKVEAQVSNPTIIWVSSAPSGACTNGSPLQAVVSTGALYSCQASTWGAIAGGGGTGFPITLGSTSIGSGSTTTNIAGLTINSTTIPTSATVTQTIASGTSALGTGSILSAACASVVTTVASGVASTDAISWNPNASIKAVTGYTPSTSGGLTIAAYPTAGNVNFDVCNWTANPITPGAVTLNWRVVR